MKGMYSSPPSTSWIKLYYDLYQRNMKMMNEYYVGYLESMKALNQSYIQTTNKVVSNQAKVVIVSLPTILHIWKHGRKWLNNG